MNRPDVQILNRKLLVDVKEIIVTPRGVDTFIWVDDAKLALVLWTHGRWSKDNQIGRNVICINTRGEVLWTMEDPADHPNCNGSASPVSKIEMTDAGYWPGNIVGWNGDHTMVIDKDTGKLLYLEFTK